MVTKWLLLLFSLKPRVESSELQVKRVPALSEGVECPYSVRVYVYEFAESLHFKKLANEARRRPRGTHFEGEHLLAQFTLEHVLTDFFEKSCIRTYDPNEAHFYFVPFFSDIEYRAAGRPNDASVHGEALLNILEKKETKLWTERFGVTDEYWLKAPERHILVQAAPVTGFRHPKGRRGWHHYKVQLLAPIFISLEITKSWVYQYPQCAAKNIILPYPVPGRSWYDNSSVSWRSLADQLVQTFDHERPLLALYRGGRHGCVNVRQAIAKTLSGDPDIARTTAKLDRAWNALGKRGPTPRQILMHLATFCPCPEGDSPSAKRQYDAILAGCIPIIISDDAVYSYDTFASPHRSAGLALNVSDFALVLSEQDAIDGKLLSLIRSITPARLSSLRYHGRIVAHLFRYYSPGVYPTDPLIENRYPDGGATSLLVWDLDRRLHFDKPHLGLRWEKCQRELVDEPHADLTKQYCGAPPKEKELARLRTQLKRGRGTTALHRAIQDWEDGHVLRRRR